MLDLKFIRGNLDTVAQALKARGNDIGVETFKEHDERRRSLLVQSEDLKHSRNSLSSQVGELYKSGQADKAEEIKGRVKDIAGQIKDFEEKLAAIDEELKPWLRAIPNMPHETVPRGLDEEDNELVKTWGEPPEFDFEPQAHWDLGEALNLLDFERAAKLSGARFAVMHRDAAKLERALVNFFLDVHTTEHGYSEVWTPYMVGSPAMFGTGQLPKFGEDLFKIEGRDLWLIPTAEVPVTNLHAQEILTEDQLPLMYTAFTPCFRAEAGSHGKDTRGLIRQHQFDKVELVTFTTPEDSYDALERLTGHAESMLERLELPYRKVILCTGDLGFSSAKTYDLEVWLPSAGVYREISSCSNFEDFQSRRAGIRFKRPGKKGTELVHTLNGSGLAVGRTLVAIMENYQQADGTIVVPKALRPYMGGKELIGR